jgi:hypothetical protein
MKIMALKKREYQQVSKIIVQSVKKIIFRIQVLTVNNKNIMIICCHDSHTRNFLFTRKL